MAVSSSPASQRARLLIVAGIFLAVTAALFFTLNLPSEVLGADSSNPQAASAAAHLFRARLSGANEVPAVNTELTGQAILALDEDMTTLHYRVVLSGVEDVTGAHIHLGEPGQNGGVVFPLPTDSLLISGTLTLSAAQRADLLAGNYYINVHTSDHPGGEIRGQIEGYALPTHLSTILSGDYERPPVTTRALGVARFTLVSTDTLEYEIAVSDIMSITAAHIHRGAFHENGPVIFPLYTGTGNFDPDHPISGTLTLTTENLMDLLTGYFYVNVHNADVTSGLIRGQIQKWVPKVYHAGLAGEGEVPSVPSEAKGWAVMGLSADMTTLHYRVMVSDIMSVTAAHIHKGEPGQNGGVIFPLYSGTGSFGPSSPVSGMLTLTADQVVELMAGDYYVNVHTAAYPGGEIRGSLRDFGYHFGHQALLYGDNEVPAVDTPALGVATVSLVNTFLYDPQLLLHYTLAVTDITGITAAHIHRGAPGQNGGVVFPLYTGTGTFDPNNPISGTLPATAESLVELATGYYYVNVHTTAHPTGEIRGRLQRYHFFASQLSGSQEVPPVATQASGSALLFLGGGMDLQYYITVSDLVSTTAAHIHQAPPGQNGPVIHPLLAEPVAMPTYEVGGNTFLSPQEIFALMRGDLYVNFHTTAHPGGEIRGQLEPHMPERELVAYLEGEYAQPPVNTEGSGIARLQFDPALGILHYQIQISDLDNLQGAALWLDGDSMFPMAVFYYNGQTPFSSYGGPFTEDIPAVGSVSLQYPFWLLNFLTGRTTIRIDVVGQNTPAIAGRVLPLREIFLPVAQ